MKEVFLKQFFKLVFYSVFLSTFIFGGFIQLFFGVPNTLMTYVSVILLSAFVLTYSLLEFKIILNKTVILFFAFVLVIVMSAIVNRSGLIKTSLYLLFFIMPLSTYMFFRVNSIKNYLSGLALKKLFLGIACLQLPIMILQKYSYSLLVQLNRSNQGIIEADIMFGSFFLKADHALGLFLLFNIFNIVLHNKNKELTRYPLLLYFYLGFTILYSESNITKLVLVVFTAYSIYKIVPKKIKSIGFAVAAIMFVFLVDEIKQIKPVKDEILFMKYEYNVEKSARNFERGIAKRPQVLITYASKIPIKIVGDGPYSYFNILKGEFALTQHFSQIIWTYADLGLIGLVVFISLLFTLVKSLILPSYMFVIIFIIMITYSLMTTIFSDIAIMITLCSLFHIKNED